MKNKIIILFVMAILVVGLVFLWVYNTGSEEVAETVLSVELSHKAGYKGYASVYDIQGKQVAEWMSPDEYIITAEVSPNSNMLSMLTLSEEGCKLRVFSLETGGERGSYLSSGCVYYVLGYVTDSEIFAISGDRITVFDTGASIISEYNFPDEYLTDYSVADGILTIALTGYRANDPGRTAIYDGEWNSVNS